MKPRESGSLMNHLGWPSYGWRINALFLDDCFHRFFLWKILASPSLDGLPDWLHGQSRDQDVGLEERDQGGPRPVGCVNTWGPTWIQPRSSSELKLVEKHHMCEPLVSFFRESASSKNLGSLCDQRFHQPCLCNETSIKTLQRRGLGELPVWGKH